MSSALIARELTQEQRERLQPIIDRITDRWHWLDEDHVIAGGAVLKLLHNKPFGDSDIDFWLLGRESSTWDKIDYIDGVLGWDHDDGNLGGLDAELSQSDNTIQAFACRWKTIEELLWEFDISICQFATDGRYVWGPANAWDDLERGVLTIIDWKQKDRLLKRVAKYQKLGFAIHFDQLKKLGDITKPDRYTY